MLLVLDCFAAALLAKKAFRGRLPSLKSPSGWKLALSDKNGDFSRPIGPPGLFDRNAIEIETHRTVRGIVDNESCRGSKERDVWPLPHDRMSLGRESHGRLRQVERDFMPAFSAAGDAEDDNLRRTRIGAEQIAMGPEGRPISRFACGRGAALGLGNNIGSVINGRLDHGIFDLERCGECVEHLFGSLRIKIAFADAADPPQALRAAADQFASYPAAAK